MIKSGHTLLSVDRTIKKLITQISENGNLGNRPNSIQDYNLWEFNVADDRSGEDGDKVNAPMLDYSDYTLTQCQYGHSTRTLVPIGVYTFDKEGINARSE